MSRVWKKYLLWFAHEHLDFRAAEINSLVSLFNIKIKYIEKQTNVPFWIAEFESENDVKRLSNRSVSLRLSIELWAQANSIGELHTVLKNVSSSVLHPYTKPEVSFKIVVETFCKHFTQTEKIEKIENFSYLPLEGNVDLKNPNVTFQYIEYYGTDSNSSQDVPLEVFFGRWIANGQRQLIKRLSLKTRKFIGNTSMDTQLSLLMANHAGVREGDLVLDPFAGSGSLLVAAACFGAYVTGTDIDYLMLHGRTKPSRIKQKERAKDESIRANMKQYNLENRYLDVMVSDFALNFWREGHKFDAIITDPPYGIRESTERIGTKKNQYIVEEKHLGSHIPAKIDYGISMIYKDLLNFAVCHLRLNGRLVCWFPYFRNDYNEEGLPQHPCLKMMSNCEQVLNKSTGRRLLTFEKISELNTSFDSLRINDNEITDFREKYYLAREETRKEKRMKEARIREENRLKHNVVEDQ